MNAVRMECSQAAAGGQAWSPRAATLPPADLENRVLRQAVQENLVSFPAQIPVFEKQSRSDLQAKLVVLYFVRGWTMDGIAQRYGLARQRMGQILTAWRIRAVKEGYIQAIEPEHPLFRRVRRDSNELSEMRPPAFLPERSGPAPSFVAQPFVVDDAKPVMPRVAEFSSSNLAEELHAIVGILDNQLRLCGKRLNGNIDSCELLLARARALCACLEAQASADNCENQTTAVAAAQELFQRFKQHAAERSEPAPKHMFGAGSKPVRAASLASNNRNVPPRTSQKVAVSVGLQQGQLPREREITFRGRSSSPTPLAP
jgi:hypothetical protein